MNINDVLNELGRELGFPESAMQRATKFADSCGQGEDMKKSICRELTEDEVKMYKAYGVMILAKCQSDPEFKKEFIESSLKWMRNN